MTIPGRTPGITCGTISFCLLLNSFTSADEGLYSFNGTQNNYFIVTQQCRGVDLLMQVKWMDSDELVKKP